VKEWESEKASLQKDKELLEQKLFELENILERMSKEIESLKASLKDKQKAVNAQETEKERLQEQERRVRKESEATIEQLQRRAQHFLRELEAKSLLCDSQSQHITLLEQSNKQMLQEKEILAAEMDKSAGAKDVSHPQSLLQQHQTLLQQHQTLRHEHDDLLSEVASHHDQAHKDIRYLLSTFVFKSNQTTFKSNSVRACVQSPLFFFLFFVFF
jgi:hypothetical protein